MNISSNKLLGKLSINQLWTFLFGCCSGTLLMLTGNTLNFWLAKLNIDLKTIGLFSLIGLPYVLKYFIAPFIESYCPFGNNKRKSWLFIFAIAILLFGTILGSSDPKASFYITALFGFFLALFAVSTDIILDSYRVDLADFYQSHGKSSSSFVSGYKIGMLVSSSGAIFLSTIISWQIIYIIFSSFITMMIFIFIKFLPNIIHNKDQDEIVKTPLLAIFLKPLNQFKSKRELFIVIVFILIYKVSDQYILSMINPFLLHLNYNEYEISFVAKTFGTFGSIIGSIIGGLLITKFGIKNCLYYFAIFHSTSNTLFILQEDIGHSLPMLYVLTAFGTVSSGMAMSVYISYIMSLCSGKYSGTRYAFYSSLMGCSRVLLPASSGYIVEILGWKLFFILMIIMSIPGIIFTKYIPYRGTTH